MKTASDGVKFFGSTSNEERRALTKQASLLINPSVREGFGLNVVEANALGVPCVAYDVPGLRDAVINNETGILVKSGDVKALAEQIVRVLKNDVFRAQLSQNALIYSKRFDWDQVAEKFMKVSR
jgi:glycosyltransferase involved in cell wall biosynthesis